MSDPTASAAVRLAAAVRRALDAVRGAAPPSAHVRLAHVRQGDWLCVPTCAALVLDGYGDPRTPAEVKALAVASDPKFRGTYFRDLIAGLGTVGYRWREETFPVTEDGFSRGFRRLKRSLAGGRPVIVGLFDPPIGHAVVLAGYDDASGTVRVVDPLLESPGVLALSYAEFAERWRENVVELRAAIFTRPRG